MSTPLSFLGAFLSLGVVAGVRGILIVSFRTAKGARILGEMAGEMGLLGGADPTRMVLRVKVARGATRVILPMSTQSLFLGGLRADF